MIKSCHKNDVVALITARGGSKRLPGKNIRILAGKPLIAWTIECALKSKLTRRVIVSTDDVKIASVAKKCGAEVPFLRPKNLAGDSSSHIAVATHALEWLKQHEGKYPQFLLLLQPTSPFRTHQDIDSAIQVAIQKKAASVIGVHEMPIHPFLAREITAKGRLRKFMKDGLVYRRKQSLPRLFAPNGAIYLTCPRAILKSKTFFPSNTYPYVMSEDRSIDIDTKWDFHLASLILKNAKRPA